MVSKKRRFSDLVAYARKRHCEVSILDRGKNFRPTRCADRFEVWISGIGLDGSNRYSGARSKAPTGEKAIDLAWDEVIKDADHWAANRY